MSAELTNELIGEYERMPQSIVVQGLNQSRRTHPLFLNLALAEESPRITEPNSSSGYDRALVSVATGMGKKWLAAFDACQVEASSIGDENSRYRPPRSDLGRKQNLRYRVSWMPHSANGTSSWYLGAQSDLSGDLVDRIDTETGSPRRQCSVSHRTLRLRCYR